MGAPFTSGDHVVEPDNHNRSGVVMPRETWWDQDQVTHYPEHVVVAFDGCRAFIHQSRLKLDVPAEGGTADAPPAILRLDQEEAAARVLVTAMEWDAAFEANDFALALSTAIDHRTAIADYRATVTS